MTRSPVTPRRVALLFVLLPLAASAQSDPTFEFRNTEAAEQKAVWKAKINAGLVVLSGNSNSISVSGGGMIGRDDGKNAFTLEGGGTYARAQNLEAKDDSGDNLIQKGEIRTVAKESAKNWNVKGRYDRFFSENNSAYLAGLASADSVAGKDLAVGGQVGYTRKLYKSDRQVLTLEAGYDFSMEFYPKEGDKEREPLQIHSLRIFSGYNLTLADEISFTTSLEALMNLNPENGPMGKAGSFEDTRIVWKLGLTAKIFKNISAAFTFTAKFDNTPAPRPDFGVPYAPGVLVPAEKLDTTTDLSLVVSFF